MHSGSARQAERLTVDGLHVSWGSDRSIAAAGGNVLDRCKLRLLPGGLADDGINRVGVESVG